MNIQMVDLGRQYSKIKNQVDEAIQQVIDTTAFIKGPAVQEFSRSFSKYNDNAHVITCGNGTDALQIAMMGLDLQPGDEVILPVHTYVATAEVIALLKLKPVFVDVDESNFNIQPEEVLKAITKKTKAIVPVHLYGQCAPMEPLLQIAEKNDLFVIEDAAQAVGAEYTFTDGKSRKAGTIGTVGATSFFPSKNLGCYGDGGALLTHNDNLAEKLSVIANHGQREKYHHDLIGVNSRLDGIQAAILNVKLRYLDEYADARRSVAKTYNDKLQEVDGLILPHEVDYSTHVYHQFTIKVKNGKRDTLQSYLKDKGIPSVIYYPLPLHLQKAYSSYGYSKGDFPVAEKLSQEVLSLPMHTEMQLNEVEYITNQLISFFKQ